MNTRESVNILSPDNKEEECAKFTITDVAVPFIITNTTSTDEEYTFSAWIKSAVESSVSIENIEIPVTTEWERYKATFVEDDAVLKIFFNKTGTYYFYKSQLEIGNVMTDWSPSSEDADASIAELNAKIELTATEISQSITAIRNDVSDLESRTLEVEASIKTKVDESTMSAAIEQSVSTVRKTANEAKDGVDSLTERVESAEASLATKVDGSTLDAAIEAKVSVVRTEVSDLENRTTQAEAKLELKVNASELISEINASADIIRLSGNRIVIDSTYFKVTNQGVITAKSGTIGEFTISSNALTSASKTLRLDSSGILYLAGNAIVEIGSSKYYQALEMISGSINLGGRSTATTGSIDSTKYPSAIIDNLGISYFDANSTSAWFSIDVLSHSVNGGSLFPQNIIADSYIATQTRFFVNNNYGIRGMKAGYDVGVPTIENSNSIAWINTANRVVLGAENNSAPTEVRSPSDLYLKCNGTTDDDSNAFAIRFFKDGNGNAWFRPCKDGSTNLGGSSYHWKNVYATNGTIQTSDANKKYNINNLDDKYIELFDLLHPKSFMMENGDRTHVGFIAQEVEDAMNQVGLTSIDFAGLCYDYDEEGNKHYALRYNELFMLCVAKLKQLERRMEEF